MIVQCSRWPALFLAGTLTAGITGCAVGPDYETPQVDVAGEWLTPVVPGEPQLRTWWQSFGDPVLDGLVNRALEQNFDLRAAQERVEEARAARDAISSGYAPAVDARGSLTERRQSENGPLPIDAIPGVERDQTIYDVGFDASWEIDLAGRTRRGVEAADARIAAAVAHSEAVRTIVAAEVSRTYLELRGAQQRLAARQAAVLAARRTRDLVQLRVSAGEAAPADLARSEAELRSLEAQLPPLDAAARGSAFALGLLLGGPPDAGIELLAESRTPVVLSAVPVGQRGDLLRRRPDVLVAERELAAATAEVGVATAELFPRLVIGANGGFQSLETGTLFDSGSETWSIVPQISWRLFDGGRVRAGIRGAEARARVAALDYERAVLAAVNDAERALSRYTFGVDALGRQQAAVEAAQRSYQYADLRYRAGEIALTELLDTERVLRGAEDSMAATHTSAAVDLVALYKALGGGWDSAAGG